ncbi:MAG: 5'/3'-nucleotidase SurE [Gammaproteobacteria bacterium]|nr:5'/3'-nucleotidase SurE [Gammaproteobacteria bacterium]
MNQSIVVTNDDGVESPGIQVLAQSLEAAGYDVMVIAPNHDASGTGTSLGSYSATEPIEYTRTSFAGLSGPVYAIGGPPALCSLLAANEAFGSIPDVVVSGINAGMNTGRSVVHSGTVGAALAAQNFGIRGMAVSVGGGQRWYWETAASVATDVLPAVIRGPSRCVVNVNVPGLPLNQIKGVRWSHLAKFGSVKAEVREVSDSNIQIANVTRSDYVPEWNTDLATTREGMVALTPLQGACEVWRSESRAGAWFDPEERVSGCMAGDSLLPPILYRSKRQGLSQL